MRTGDVAYAMGSKNDPARWMFHVTCRAADGTVYRSEHWDRDLAHAALTRWILHGQVPREAILTAGPVPLAEGEAQPFSQLYGMRVLRSDHIKPGEARHDGDTLYIGPADLARVMEGDESVLVRRIPSR